MDGFHTVKCHNLQSRKKLGYPPLAMVSNDSEQLIQKASDGIKCNTKPRTVLEYPFYFGSMRILGIKPNFVFNLKCTNLPWGNTNSVMLEVLTEENPLTGRS